MKHKAKPTGSSGGSRLRFAILAATVAAFLLVPAAQAMAIGTTEVKIAGSGSGEVSSVEGIGAAGGFALEGTPAIECSYVSPGPAGPTCKNTENGSIEGEDSHGVERELEGVWLIAHPGPGSEFGGWTVEEGFVFLEGYNGGVCRSTPGPQSPQEKDLEEHVFGAEAFKGGMICFAYAEPAGGNVVAEVTFTSVFPLKLEKTTTNGGEGTVVSNPAGINCGPSCATETATLSGEVVLTASPAAGSVFTSWTGCSIKAEGHKCYVSMSAARTVKAKFTKALPVTAVKDPTGTGTGTLSSSPAGIGCGPTCNQATALFTEGAASFVTVKEAPLTSTSEFAGWTGGCPGLEEEAGKKCKVTMTVAKTVEAKFNLIPPNPLTVTKAGAGTGTVTTSPAGISCGATCSTATASFLPTKSVTLKEVISKGSTFGGWTGSCEGSGETCVVGLMTGPKSVTAEFE